MCHWQPSNTLLLSFPYMFSHSNAQMMKPELQNDFSFYRRALGSKAVEQLPKPVQPDVAQVISMWVAQNLPMTVSITNNDPLPLAALANICCGMILRQACGATLSHVLKVSCLFSTESSLQVVVGYSKSLTPPPTSPPVPGYGSFCHSLRPHVI